MFDIMVIRQISNFFLDKFWRTCTHNLTNKRLVDTHYNDVIMGAIAFQITSLKIVYSIVYSDADQRKQ